MSNPRDSQNPSEALKELNKLMAQLPQTMADAIKTSLTDLIEK